MLPSPLQPLASPRFTRHQVEVFIKRDDLIHPIISGNKWRKLAGNIAAATQQGKSGIASFGGAYSNHIHALAYACQQQGLNALGFIRGEAEYANNYTLTWAQHWGMSLKFLTRAEYRQRSKSEFILELQQQYPDYFFVPEGGSNQYALIGMQRLIAELNQQINYDTLLCPVGSGGTIAGILAADHGEHQIVGIAVLKQADYLRDDIAQLSQCSLPANFKLLTNYHRGGYAKFSAQDCLTLAEFSQQTGVPFEPVYSGKMLLALFDLLEQGYFAPGQRIVLLHTGGIQGIGGQIERQLVPETYIKTVQSHLPSAPPVR